MVEVTLVSLSDHKSLLPILPDVASISLSDLKTKMANTDLIARVYPSSHDHLARHAAKAIIDSSYYVSPLYEEPEEKIQYGRDDRERTEPPDEPGDRKPSEFDGKPFIEIQFSEARDPRVEFNLDVAV
ncbi:hypothetical protein J3458_002650 [Metarhizium acridum]|uniref:uncharacterized protein n=1 Tax=Metarhizium acridum TaxID=92637 RepID=UPI001C6CE812|nr:hypothetical protein J3458_002650 [Metarhizium acridum]